MKFSEVIERVIHLAAAVNTARKGRRPHEPGKLRFVRLDQLPAEPPPPEWHELRRFLLAQSPATIYMLEAVMYHGRGDFDPELLLDEYVELSDTFHKPESAVMQMMGKGPLAEYLEDGVKELTAAGVDLDRLLGPI